MLKLLASAPEDGWAFVQNGEDTLLVRPPYQQWALTNVTEEVVAAAVQRHGFMAHNETFADWNSLVSNLRGRYLEWRKEQGFETPNADEIRSLIHLAPPYILAEYLDRIEFELLPQGEWRPAMKLLTYLLSVKTLKADISLYERTVQLLRQSQEARITREEQLRGLLANRDISNRFPHAARIYGASAVFDLAREISQNHQIFPPA